ncbi:Ig-like domain-containing protein [Stratiformator vulcanicus]|uniref:Cadherin-like domain-containing protein n=1 Tax=Stratiformator vulcanicus TaxID=2527980 RepID=A0A517QXX2_9PLAN|nr:Ig-like domain-containing protein [Stratiformator vulcanicus]QDT36453.1 hypothetical protein Pan189_08090 [Stratiformator vulcanicus]
MVVTKWLRSLYADSFRPRRRRRGFTAIEPLEQRVMLSGTATDPQTIDIDWHQTQKRISTGWRDSLLLDELNDPSAQITGHSNFTPANGVDGGQLEWVSKWGGIDWIAPTNFSTNADDELVASFDITVDNGTDTYDATVNIKLNNSAVTAADDAFVINNEDDIYTGWRGPLFDNDNDSDGDDLTTTTQRDVSTDGGVAKWLSKRGGLFYKPDADYLGVDELSYTVTDGVSSDSADVKIAVVGDINITLSEDTAVGTYVATLPAEWASDPFSVSLSNSEYFEIEEIDGEHKLKLIKQLDYESTGYIDGKSWKGVGFTEAFEVTATQGAATGFAVASGRVVVTIKNLKPYANTDFYTIEMNETLEVDRSSLLLLPTENDFDFSSPPGMFAATIVSGPSNGILSFDSVTGEFTYTPNPDFAGEDRFTYEISDGELSDVANVYINVVAYSNHVLVQRFRELHPHYAPMFDYMVGAGYTLAMQDLPDMGDPDDPEAKFWEAYGLDVLGKTITVDIGTGTFFTSDKPIDEQAGSLRAAVRRFAAVTWQMSTTDVEFVSKELEIRPELMRAWLAMTGAAYGLWQSTSGDSLCHSYSATMYDAASPFLLNSDRYILRNRSVGFSHWGVYIADATIYDESRKPDTPTVIFHVGSGLNPLWHTTYDGDWPIRLSYPGDPLPPGYYAYDIYHF